MRRVVCDPETAIDQVGHPMDRPEARLVSKPLRSILQRALDRSKLRVGKLGLTPRAPGLLESLGAQLLQGQLPSVHRLAMDPEFSGDLGLRGPLLEQPCRLQAAGFQRIEISSHTSWISHARSIAHSAEKATILFNNQ